ncbi:virulence factor SrfB [Novispirillum sp. DQ9]|uniref:virulence factor SrfB n=1 Tax=Novispirillum sp. DQ9 TaxID=3398612 RepID=UPI003C7A7D36
MIDFPRYKKLVSLVPGGPLQFLDLGFSLDLLPRLREEFWEYDEAGGTGETVWVLRNLKADEAGNGYIDRQSGGPATDPRSGRPVEPLYAIGAEKALEPFLDQWVPLPFLRLAPRHAGGDAVFHRGPTNWCRGRISRLPEHDPSGNTHALTIAFDPAVEGERPDVHHAALSREDVTEGAEFGLAARIRDNDWFLQRDWVRDWIKDLYLAHLRSRSRSRRPVREEDLEHRVEHLARYLTFLKVLDRSGVVPRVRVVDPERFQPVQVDLVLDIGNSRTCGMLIERDDSGAPNMSNGAVLELRDLTAPPRRYTEPFGSNLAFGVARFGDPNDWSLMSNRRTPAFAWPSVVRVGPEARRIALRSRREEGQTSMSSPKRYLWDHAARRQEWRFCPESDDADAPELPVTTGAFVMHVNDRGTPLHVLERGGRDLFPALRGQPADPVTAPAFSRSSMMMFLLSEVIAQALVHVNSPAQRGDRANSDIPRQLRHIILTVPTAMSITERRIFTRWAEWAVTIVWRALGWDGGAGGATGFRAPPQVRCEWDEASTTQMVWLYNEVAEKFAGDIGAAFATLGRRRSASGDGRPSLRVASLDIGGGTTDLIITTYFDRTQGAAGVIEPRQDFREGFMFAGDDILKAVIENHFVSALRTALEAAGVPDAGEFLARHLGKDYSGQAEHQRNLRVQFVDQVAVPYGLRILHLAETTPLSEAAGTTVTLRHDDVFADPADAPRPEVLSFIEEDAMRQGAAGFRLAELEVPVDLEQVAATITNAVAVYLNDLGEVIHHYGCDVLLLSGRPSCLPAVQAAVLRKAPVPAARCVPLNGYKVGHWYPFWTPGGRIADPKTTAVVGAALCALAEGSLRNFHFDTARLRPASTCRYMGEMTAEGQVLDAHLFFSGLDLDGADEEEMTATLKFSAPIYIGFRQVPLERWKSTTFYHLGFAGQTAIQNARGRLPYEVVLTYRRDPRADPDDPRAGHGGIRDEGAFFISEVTGADGAPVRTQDLDLRLKTMREENGHWLDTGLLTVA